MTLADKGYFCKNKKPFVYVYTEEDLKQAIKELNNYFVSDNVFSYVDCLQIIKKIFGEDLVE